MRGNKGIIGLALIAALALMVATVGATASASGGSAVAAKKKCKKKKKAQSAKKKKCKKKKATATTAISQVRATLTWSEAATTRDYGPVRLRPERRYGQGGSDPISKTSFTLPNAIGSLGHGDIHRSSTSTSTVRFAFGVCYQDGGNDGSHAYTIDYVTATE